MGKEAIVEKIVGMLTMDEHLAWIEILASEHFNDLTRMFEYKFFQLYPEVARRLFTDEYIATGIIGG